MHGFGALILTDDTAGKLASRGLRGRRPPRSFSFAPGSGGKAARTRCKNQFFLQGKALQTSHLSKPAVSLSYLVTAINVCADRLPMLDTLPSGQRISSRCTAASAGSPK